MATGKLLVIEGLDGSGKATQTELLYQALVQRGLAVRKVSYPNYASNSSALVKMYLAGELGSHPEDVNAYAASSFYAVDRYADYKMNWEQFLQQGGIVIADRYTTSNAVHQCSKLPDEQWEDFLAWLFAFEYDRLGIPAPAKTVYLHVDPEVSQRLMSRRYRGDESKKDIHEKDMTYLRRSQQAAAYCAEHLGWAEVKCHEQGEMRSMERIHQDVLRAVAPTLGIEL